MKKILIPLVLLAAAPAALAAQHAPVPLPPDSAQVLPARLPLLIPQGPSRASEAVAGAMEGALDGAVEGVRLGQSRQGCAPAVSLAESGVSGAASGLLRGGLRGLFGVRGPRGRIRTDLPEGGATALPAVTVVGAGAPRCGALSPDVATGGTR